MKVRFILSSSILVLIISLFQNCSPTNFQQTSESSNLNFDTNLNSEEVTAFQSKSISDQKVNKIMYNRLTTTGEGKINSASGKQIKNIIVYQAGGWSGLMETKLNGVDFPIGGKDKYITRNDQILLKQMDLIKKLGDSVAITVLLMDDEDSNASGYGTCWNGYWIADKKCSPGGTWLLPRQMYEKVRWAAWMKGLSVSPNLSIMNYAHKQQGQFMLPKLKKMTDWAVQYDDYSSLKTSDNKLVIVVDSLQESAGMNDKDRMDLLNYMKSKPNILWVDNLVGDTNLISIYNSTNNIIRSAAYFDPKEKVQGATVDWIKQLWGSRFSYWFTTGFGKTYEESIRKENNVPQNIRERWLNINPYDPTHYPTIISQWNEYGESLIFEPSYYRRNNNYDYLKWMISRQK